MGEKEVEFKIQQLEEVMFLVGLLEGDADHLRVVKALLGAGADPNIQTNVRVCVACIIALRGSNVHSRCSCAPSGEVPMTLLSKSFFKFCQNFRFRKSEPFPKAKFISPKNPSIDARTVVCH